MKLSTAMTMIVSAMSGANQFGVLASYSLFNGDNTWNTGYCRGSKTQAYSIVRRAVLSSPGVCTPWTGTSQAFKECSDWCGQHTPPNHVGMEIERVLPG
eukprot:scaffold80512_cov60-Cyclotella_meneghiniana.AAC.1